MNHIEPALPRTSQPPDVPRFAATVCTIDDTDLQFNRADATGKACNQRLFLVFPCKLMLKETT